MGKRQQAGERAIAPGPGRGLAARVLLASGILLAAAVLSAPAAAVPIPFKNCGKPGDLLSIAMYDSSVWPPQSAAPFTAIATTNTAGQITNLSIFFVFGVAWTFDTGPLPSSATGGFVPLPASMPVTVTSPPLPLAAGPYFINHTFPGEFGPTTIVSKANLAAQLNPPLTTTLSLSFDGTPGFQTKPVAGGVYDLHVQMTESSGAEVFCVDLSVPFKNAVAPVQVVGTPIPALSWTSLAVLAVLVAGCGLLAARQPKRQSQRKADPVS